jgi:general secretion pathway protein C
MLARLSAFVIWGLVAATAIFWALRLWVQAPGAPEYTVAVGSVGAVSSDLTRLLGTTSSAVAAAPIPQAASRFKLFGIMAPDARRAAVSQGGLALIAVDDKPARAYAVGTPIDDGLVLQSVSLRTASIGPAEGETTLRLELPALPAAATGTLAPATGFFTPPGAGASVAPAAVPSRTVQRPSATLPARVPIAPGSRVAPGQRGGATR